MPDLPTGTITHLFTDLEASTQLWQQHPDAMRPASARHDGLLRQAIADHQGLVVKTTGDGFHAVFTEAPLAVAAALAAQRALQAQAWETVPALRVRMALHTAAADLRDGDYYGAAVNRAARLMAAGHGGQVLLSLATEELARDHLPEGAGLRELGDHRLKDLARPERVYQLCHPDLASDFPPLCSLDSLPNNLPRQLTSFIGREREVAEVKQILGVQGLQDTGGQTPERLITPTPEHSHGRTSARLVTLTGSGGCGKSRLSLQVAADLLDGFQDGAWLVELAPLSDPEQVLGAVASALGVTELPGQPLTQTLAMHLRAKRLLIVLDNCEHLLDACAAMADRLLRDCPRLVILASSREGLGVAGEQTYRIPSLSLPDPSAPSNPAQISQYDAVQLFIDRALTVQPGFTVTNQNAAAVAQICHRLDGIPLAVELAATRIRVLTPEQIAVRLDNCFRLLTGGSRTALPRQQTLRALIDWSYNLLDGDERALLLRLAVFAGGWTLEAAEAVCGCPDLIPPTDAHTQTSTQPADVLDLLSRLMDKSLVQVEGPVDGEMRYRLLETVRQYAREKLLESGECACLRTRHLGYFLSLAEAASPRLRTAEQMEWLDRLTREHSNLLAALEWALADDRRSGLCLAGALGYFWYLGCHWTQGLEWLRAALEPCANAETEPARALALCWQGWLMYSVGDLASLRAGTPDCLALARQAGDPWLLNLALLLVALDLSSHWDAPEALEIAAEMDRASELHGDAWLCALNGVLVAEVAVLQAQLVEATRHIRQAQEMAERSGDRWLIGIIWVNLANAGILEGDLAAARAAARAGLVHGQALHHAVILCVLVELGAALAHRHGDSARAARLFGAASTLRESSSYAVEPGMQGFHSGELEAIRVALGEEAFAAEWRAGRDMSLELAIACAFPEAPDE